MFGSLLFSLKNYLFPTPLSANFDILTKLGSGGFSKVYLARRKHDAAFVAVKKIKDKKIDEYVHTQLGDLPLEIYIAITLQHPNIIRTNGFLKANHSWAMIMEYCKNYVDLTSLIEINDHLSYVTARKIIIQTYKALTYCFKNNVVHKDIKSDNILVHWENHHVKLIDFGVSAFLKPKTPVTEGRGTDIFMPPEYFNRGSYDPLPGTVWALGCLLYCMVFGELPFIDVHEVLYKTLEIPDINSQGPPLERESCVDLIRRCLDRDSYSRITYRNISTHPWIKTSSAGKI